MEKNNKMGEGHALEASWADILVVLCFSTQKMRKCSEPLAVCTILLMCPRTKPANWCENFNDADMSLSVAH